MGKKITVVVGTMIDNTLIPDVLLYNVDVQQVVYDYIISDGSDIIEIEEKENVTRLVYEVQAGTYDRYIVGVI